MHGSMVHGCIVLTRSVEAHVLVHDAASCWVLKLQSLFLDVLHLLFWVILEKFSFAPIVSVSTKATLRWHRFVLDHDGLQFGFHFRACETLAILNERCLVANINSKRCYIYIYICIYIYNAFMGGRRGEYMCSRWIHAQPHFRQHTVAVQNMCNVLWKTVQCRIRTNLQCMLKLMYHDRLYTDGQWNQTPIPVHLI